MIDVPTTPLPPISSTPKKKNRCMTYFLIYLPVFILFSLIIMIYVTYFTKYLYVLLTSETYNDKTFPFIHTTSTQNGKTKGIVLTVITGTSMLLLTISMLRTIFVDPGYFPDPTLLEVNIVARNSPHRKKFFKKKQNNKPKEMSEVAIENETSIKAFEEKKAQKKKEFLKSFGKTLNNGPLTFYEFSNCNQKLIDYIDDKQNTLHTFLNNERASNFAVEFSKKSKEPVKFPSYHSYKKKPETDTLLNEEECVEEDEPIIPNDPTNLEFIFEHFKNIDLSKANLCNSCLRWKFERSHHCRQCGKCVLKMDHHCPWLANCIGFRNYKYFCLIHLHGTVGTFFIFISFWEVIFNNLVFDSSNVFMYSFLVFIYIANLGLMCFLIWLFSANFKLVFSGQTIIEQSDRERFPSSKSTNIYDLGYYRNFKAVFGENCLTWLLPFNPNYNGLGLIFETNENSSRR